MPAAVASSAAIRVKSRRYCRDSLMIFGSLLFPTFLWPATTKAGSSAAAKVGAVQASFMARPIGKAYRMNIKTSEDAHPARKRRRLSTQIKDSLRELSIQLTLLNRQVVAHLDFNDGDLPCLDLIARHGPLSPSALARRAGLHPATVTGILDRLERGGWVV